MSWYIFCWFIYFGVIFVGERNDFCLGFPTGRYRVSCFGLHGLVLPSWEKGGLMLLRIFGLRDDASLLENGERFSYFIFWLQDSLGVKFFCLALTILVSTFSRWSSKVAFVLYLVVITALSMRWSGLAAINFLVVFLVLPVFFLLFITPTIEYNNYKSNTTETATAKQK